MSGSPSDGHSPRTRVGSSSRHAGWQPPVAGVAERDTATRGPDRRRPTHGRHRGVACPCQRPYAGGSSWTGMWTAIEDPLEVDQLEVLEGAISAGERVEPPWGVEPQTYALRVTTTNATTASTSDYKWQ